MILVTGSFLVRESRLAEALCLSIEHVRGSRREDGCISHCVQQDAENPLCLVFLERWQDREALAAHFAVPASRAFVKAAKALAAQAPTIEIYEATPVRFANTNL